MSTQALKDSLPAGGVSGQGGISVNVTASPPPQQQPKGPYNEQVPEHGSSLVLMA